MLRGRDVRRLGGVDAIVRHGLPRSWRDVHHLLIATTWPRFLAILVAGHATLNALLSANGLVARESTVGVLALPIVTGLVFARFARPTAQVMFSRQALTTVVRTSANWPPQTISLATYADGRRRIDDTQLHRLAGSGE